MELIFVCPKHGGVFETADFSIVENRGVVTDGTGKKRLNAKVALEKPCPLCGQAHVYGADELACPFEDAAGEEIQQCVAPGDAMSDRKKIRLTETVTGAG